MTERVLVHGTTFLLCDDRGDAIGGRHGLFLADTRHLSRWELVTDELLRLLRADVDGSRLRCVLAPATARGDDPRYTVLREQVVDGHGLAERVLVRSHVAESTTVPIGYRVSADFADQFELRGTGQYTKPGGTHTRESTVDGVRFGYRRHGFRKDTAVRADRDPSQRGELLCWQLELPPLGEAELTVAVGAAEHPPLRPPGVVAAAIAAEHQGLLTAAALPRIDWPQLRTSVEAGIADLAALCIPAPGNPALRVPGAGVPWFQTLFGRDSLITSLAALPYLPELAVGTLHALAALQGSSVDPARLEEPGKIPHEVRQGELSVCDGLPWGRYYGTVDATPLFLVLLGRHRRLAGDAVALRLEAAARAAVDWLHRYGGVDEHGYLVYRTDGPGLVHQCWKDSARSICFASGRPATGPIAVCEAQGYAYEALLLTAELAREVWHDPPYANRLAARAERLRADFLHDFWLPEQDFVALALDGERHRVDALASNAGHLLWSGLLPPEQATVVGQRLLQPDFFAGWGIRTLAAGQAAYHPVSYHNGAVWPHDTAITAAGLAAVGLPEHAGRVAEGLVAAAARLDYRLPEVLTGFGRDEVPAPVPYPHSAIPQAWAAAAPLLLLTALGT